MDNNCFVICTIVFQISLRCRITGCDIFDSVYFLVLLENCDTDVYVWGAFETFTSAEGYYG